MRGDQQITGIIKTMPHKFVFEEYGAVRFIEHFFYGMNADPEHAFLFTMPSIPRYDVLHFYLLVDGRIRFRANIAGYEPAGTKIFWAAWGWESGAKRRSVHGNAWVRLTAPVVRAPFKIEMKGFRGFRYTGDLW